jgi:hypothetical protein
MMTGGDDAISVINPECVTVLAARRAAEAAFSRSSRLFQLSFAATPR